MKTIKDLQTRLQEISLERMNLTRSFDQMTGAMIELENQIKALTPQDKVEEEVTVGNTTDSSS
tara:strand:+ start:1215 stop:1403 length:189 start_codon:yes stop_codon:yes gene_type:complete